MREIEAEGSIGNPTGGISGGLCTGIGNKGIWNMA
ncbi:hypothetical protein CLOL250_00617 [Clostridium sp. L2-50]|nr:hypothetical protein CLOL250_00617 [Clostridium sp. L2-50]